ncbi:hypothetical protein [Arthrobacter globiformis]|nr:hypothetical protein [Arthrobacter globiformis]
MSRPGATALVDGEVADTLSALALLPVTVTAKTAPKSDGGTL